MSLEPGRSLRPAREPARELDSVIYIFIRHKAASKQTNNRTNRQTNDRKKQENNANNAILMEWNLALTGHLLFDSVTHEWLLHAGGEVWCYVLGSVY